MSKMHAYRLMDSSGVVDTIKGDQEITAANVVAKIADMKSHPMGYSPANERQVRPLARLEPEQQKEAWQRAVETAPDGKVTAAHVYKIVKGMTATGSPSEISDQSR